MTLVWTAEDVLRAVQGQCLHEQNWVAHGVSIDSRTCQPGDLYVAIKGDKMDGHAYVGAAFEKGAVAAIVSQTPPQVSSDAPLLVVRDTFTALQELGRAGRARASAKILAVTGSVGKTSTKDMLRLMLSAAGSCAANEGSLNNHWGVPLSLARLAPDAAYGVFEIGMNHAGELGPLSREVKPSVALITNVEAAHLEFFGTTDAIADAKAEIFLGMEPSGLVVLNRDNPQFDRLAAAARAHGLKKILSFGRAAKCDARLIDLKLGEDSSEVEAEILGSQINFSIGAPGAHLAMNAMGALLAACAAGADPMVCADALASFKTVSGRGTRRTLPLASGGTITLFDDAYNAASPVTIEAAAAVLGGVSLPKGGRRLAALGDMRELGPASPALHAGLAPALEKAGISRVFCCGPLMRHLYDALPPAFQAGYAETSEALAPLVASAVHANDMIVVKGSKSMLMQKIIKALDALAVPAQEKDGPAQEKKAV